ncbi:lytic transglycosylase [Rhodanobacter sp. B04]|uniref:lytic transglycosylase domain-containing protein n=1 Tax=Rhodanobacter sp. B04 TaxID=1945860 RepID=UPI000984C926|nr:lytic transglycosylase domain-containing protein [Rhodanobacter sp. B04]OOG63893.1 lytic transglycosylase [Rhodanobacter sp. B04]
MFDVASHGGSVDRPARSFPSHSILFRVVLGCALLWAGGWCAQARAGTLYRCTGASGEVAFSSSKIGYHGCKPISTYAASAPAHQAPPRISLTGVTGSVETSARRLVADEVEPVSLARVQATVETTARPLDAGQLRHASLAAVHGSVETTAKLPLAAAAAGTPGQWSYHESHDAPAPPAVVADDPGTRILRGAVYRIVRADGSVEYTNLPVAGQKGRTVTMLFSYIATCVACDLHSTIRWGSVSLNLTAYADTIRAASMEYGVDEAFLRAIIHAESAFNPRALSLKGAQGLMQLMPATASDMGVLDAFNTDQNIRGGARYLSLLLHNFNGNERLAAAAYNAGPGAVQRYSGVPPYAETQVYVERVETLRKRYGAAIHPPLASARGPG